MPVSQRLNTLTILFPIIALGAGLLGPAPLRAAWFGPKPAPEVARATMVRTQLAVRDITDPAVLKAMGKVPRERFVPNTRRDHAYEDHPLPIGYGQTISQPYIVAYMTQVLKLRPGDRVLEIGTGSGYQAAVLAEMGMRVYSMEIVPQLSTRATATLSAVGYRNVAVRQGDGYFGWPEQVRFDAIMVTAAASHIPPVLLRQLKPGGRLVIPLGSTLYYQNLTLITKIDAQKVTVEQLLDVRFVPMTGQAHRDK